MTQSGGLGRNLGKYLRGGPDLVDRTPKLDVKISGCPNGCGQHHVAAIGFQGSLRNVSGRAAPQYFVMVGGGTGGDEASFGRVVAKIPARRCVTALDRRLRLYADERRTSESAEKCFQRVDLARITALFADLTVLTADTATADDFIDLGETSDFRPETLEGEIGIGGESGIRTHGRVSPTHAFQACSFNHSDISPL